MEIKPEYKNKIIAILNALFPEAKIYLFGSYAQGKARHGSDIDLALDAGKKIEPRVRLGEARDVLAELYIPLNIDLVDFHDIPEALQKSISQDKIIWKD